MLIKLNLYFNVGQTFTLINRFCVVWFHKIIYETNSAPLLQYNANDPLHILLSFWQKQCKIRNGFGISTLDIASSFQLSKPPEDASYLFKGLHAAWQRLIPHFQSPDEFRSWQDSINWNPELGQRGLIAKEKPSFTKRWLQKGICQISDLYHFS